MTEKNDNTENIKEVSLPAAVEKTISSLSIISKGDAKDEKIIKKINRLMNSAAKLAEYAGTAAERAAKAAKKKAEKKAKLLEKSKKINEALKLLESD